MLKLRDEQLTLWDAILPEAIRKLPAELAAIDKLLDDDIFLEPFVKLHPKGKKSGRPTLAIEKYLRLTVLKHKYHMGDESLVKEVGDSITWRLFCRFAIDEPMPHPSTLVYARKRYGDKIIDMLNAALVAHGTQNKILKTRKFRTDTTVVAADIHHPTDATLLQDGVRVITRLARQTRAIASHAVQGFEDRTTEVKKHILSIAKVLRRRTHTSYEDINRITGRVAEVAESVLTEARDVIEKLSRSSRAAVQQKRAAWLEAVARTDKLLAQAKQVMSGHRRIPDRMISFFDPEARPINKGKLAKVTEFGYKVRIDETESGFVTGYAVYQGNPSDDELLMPAIADHIRSFGKPPQAVATDRGFSCKQNEEALAGLDVKRISLPRRGKKGAARTAYEKEKWFVDMQRYRAAGEAKISLLKRKYGLDRSRYRGLSGTRSWVGFGILTHNLYRAAKMNQS